MLSPSKISKILNVKDITLKKSFGQHFIISKPVIEKIIDSCNLEKNDTVLEIGPGAGNLTEYLLKKVSCVIAVEKDISLIDVLKKRFRENNLIIYPGDILKLDIKSLTQNRKVKVIGNLPYYISSSILEYIFKNKEYVSSLYCSLQREFAERLVAKPSSRQYSRLTLFTNYHARASILFQIKAGSFYPAPKVTSSFLRLDMRTHPPIKVSNEEFFFKLIKGSFSSRRKKLINCLTAYCKIPKEDLCKIFKQIDIDPNDRAEDIDIKRFAALSNLLLETVCS